VITVPAGGAVLVLVASVLAALGLVVPPVLEVEQRRQLAVGDHHDRAAVATVAARRAAARDAVFAPHRRRAVAAIAGLHVDDGFVDELHRGQA
jgi:hypothetical protein